MIDENEIIEIKLNSKNMEHYKSKGYNFDLLKKKDKNGQLVIHHGTKILVKITDLPEYSKYKITVKCDYCNKIFKRCYNNYICGKSHCIDKDACLQCSRLKSRETYKTNYGKTIEDIKNEFNDRNCDLISSEYINSSALLLYICRNHKDKGILTISYNAFHSGKGCRYCYLERNSGENHPCWNPNKTDEEREKKREYKEYKDWSHNVLDRDNYICQICGKHGGKLSAHHLNGYHWCKEERTDIENGITLCWNCHLQFHKIFGKCNNTKEQYLQFVKQYKPNEFIELLTS